MLVASLAILACAGLAPLNSHKAIADSAPTPTVVAATVTASAVTATAMDTATQPSSSPVPTFVPVPPTATAIPVTPTQASGQTDITVDAIAPVNVVQGSGATITITGTNLSDSMTVSLENLSTQDDVADITDVTVKGNTLSFTLPDTLLPGDYAMTLHLPGGNPDGSDAEETVPYALTVEKALTLQAHLNRTIVKRGSYATLKVDTVDGASYYEWLTTPAGKLMPNGANASWRDMTTNSQRNNGEQHLQASVYFNRHLPASSNGTQYIVHVGALYGASNQWLEQDLSIIVKP